ncbi:hypothetical protein PG997_012839 [Apiospora hydei]|uniref:Uncharacterized protein n=1 Tax=Apiospora hydei TaxID=1337664 RepID=A0ABR1V4H0_9PEZI
MVWEVGWWSTQRNGAKNSTGLRDGGRGGGFVNYRSSPTTKLLGYDDRERMAGDEGEQLVLPSGSGAAVSL